MIQRWLEFVRSAPVSGPLGRFNPDDNGADKREKLVEELRAGPPFEARMKRQRARLPGESNGEDRGVLSFALSVLVALSDGGFVSRTDFTADVAKLNKVADERSIGERAKERSSARTGALPRGLRTRRADLRGATAEP